MYEKFNPEKPCSMDISPRGGGARLRREPFT